MTNVQIIEALVEKLGKKIEWRMAEFGDTYAQAKAKISEESVAGPAVWSVLDARFA